MKPATRGMTLTWRRDGGTGIYVSSDSEWEIVPIYPAGGTSRKPECWVHSRAGDGNGHASRTLADAKEAVRTHLARGEQTLSPA